MNRRDKYILITAAHNEEKFIELTIKSVINQQLKPLQWVIVNDNSTDRTGEIIKKYLRDNNFIKLLNIKRKDGRDFSSKVYAINEGFKSLKNIEFDFIGILDADVSFEPNFYSTLIAEFHKNKKLGIVGGDYFDIVNGQKKYIKPSPYSVRGATQFFRRECFEQIGGLIPLKYGGEDALACYAARKHGWDLLNVKGLIVIHHKPTGSGSRNMIKANFFSGIMEHHLGYHPLFQFFKTISRLFQPPFIVGGICRFAGYWYSNFKGINDIKKNDEIYQFIKRDQLKRLYDTRNIFKGNP
jgi:glycosyltransferase involved in cell wall biosynthesis